MTQPQPNNQNPWNDAETAPLGETAEDATADAPPPAPQPAAMAAPSGGRRIGRYQVVREVATGGMGTVFEAVQENPRRTVALKLMKHGMTSRAAMRRFEYESHILALLSHPNIAKVFEAGTHDDGSGGVPFFAMEYIERAQMLVEYAFRNFLSTRDRLMLFVKICDAVHHGHVKGIIHRDLKPGNILVDQTGEPKIIDFGVARATDSDIAVTTVQTDVGQLVGTVQYMSPEQCAADPDNIDTRSDVYALGVVLYELLCERMPYDVSRKALHEVVRTIQEEPPTRLSTVRKDLRGDLETIASKAMEKSRDRRYQSALELRDDIVRYLNNEPIEARPPSLVYQMSKFARRHRALVASAVVLFVVMLAATFVSISFAVYAKGKEIEATNASNELRDKNQELVEAWEAEQRQRKAVEEVTNFQTAQLAGIDVQTMGAQLRRDLLQRAEQSFQLQGMDANDVSIRMAELADLLESVNFTDAALTTLDENYFSRAMDALEDRFDDQPAVKGQLYQTLANTMLALGLTQKARVPLERAYALRSEALGPDASETLESLNDLGRLARLEGRYDEAETYYREIIAAAKRLFGDEHRNTLIVTHNLAVLLDFAGRLDESRELHEQNLDARKRSLGENHPDTLVSMNSLALLLQNMGHLEEAEVMFRDAAERARATLGNDDQQTVELAANLGSLLLVAGQPEEAEPLCIASLEHYRRALGEKHPLTVVSLNTVGMLYTRLKQFDKAEPYLRQATETATEIYGPDHGETLVITSNLGVMLREMGRFDEAEAIGRDTAERSKAVFGEDHWNVGALSLKYAVTLLKMQQYQQSAEVGRKAYDVLVNAFQQSHPRVREAVEHLLNVYSEWQAAEPNEEHESQRAHWQTVLEGLAAGENGT